MKEQETIDSAVTMLISDTMGDKPDFKKFEGWLNILYPDIDKLKAVAMGCAIFKRDAQMAKLFAQNKLDKRAAKYKIEVSQIYLDLANQYLNCAR